MPRLRFLHRVPPRATLRPLAFGLLHAFFSAPGQTFCIALFVGAIGASLGLDAAAMGGIYMAATVGAALLLIPAGHPIDRMPLQRYSSLATLGLAAACFVMAGATSALWLGVALLGLRLTGQGLMTHIEATTTARAFRSARGRALGVTALGLPIAEGLFPPLVVLGLELMGWRWTYAAIGILVLVVLLPASRHLASGIAAPGAAAPAVVSRGAPPGDGRGPAPTDRPRLREGLRLLAGSRYVWCLVPLLVAHSLVGTALLFHAPAIAAGRGWSTALLAASFPALAIGQVVGLLVSGPLVDRYSAAHVFPTHVVPIVAAALLLGLGTAPAVLPAALFASGLGSGIAKTSATALWAETFGTRNLGAIRSAIMMVMVLASAIGPFALGVMLTAGWGEAGALVVMAAGGALAHLPLLGYLARSRHRSRP